MGDERDSELNIEGMLVPLLLAGGGAGGRDLLAPGPTVLDGRRRSTDERSEAALVARLPATMAFANDSTVNPFGVL